MNTIWDLDGIGLKAEVSEAARNLRAWLSDRENHLAKILTGRLNNNEPHKNQMPDLERDIIEAFKPLRQSVHYLEALTVVVDRGNAAGIFKLCPPRVPILIKRDPSPFLPDKLITLSRAPKWRQALADTITGKQSLSAMEAIGQILCSAALNGGALSTSLLRALYQQMENPIEVLEGRSFFDLRLPWRGTEDMELRRWFPDEITESLWLRLSIDHLRDTRGNQFGHPASAQEVWRCIKAFLARALPDTDDRPANISVFFESILLELQIRVPVFLATFASRSFISHSLKDHAWKRLHGHRPLAGADPEDVPASQNSEQDSASDQDDSRIDPDWLRDIRRALNAKDKNQAARLLAELSSRRADPPFAMPALFVGWAQFMLSKGSAIGNTLALSTIRSYVSQVAIRVVGLTAFGDVTQMSSDGLEEIYQQILEQAQSGHQRRFLARGLREFHHHLVEKYEIEPINPGEVLGIGAGLSPVDANLITFDEYHEVLSYLDTNDLELDHPDLVTVAKLIFILAFRCGLRRSEVLKLEIGDIHAHDPAELLVRPYAHRRLKTKSAIRKLPLYALLGTQELDLLRSWKAKRVDQETRNPRFKFLFSIPQRGYAVVPEETVFPILHRAMRTVCADPTLRFHHLRHSFASWLFLRMELSDLPKIPDLFPHLLKTSAYLTNSKEFRGTLYGNMRPTRKHLYAVASLLGHSGPDISLEHYIHFCDLALSLHLTAHKRVDRRLLVSASGLSEATAYRRYEQNGVTGVLNVARKKAGTRVRSASLKATSTTARQDQRVSEEEASPLHTIERIWKYLYLRSARDLDLEAMAQRFGFGVAQAASMEECAGHIRDLAAPGSERTRRHRMMDVVVDQTDLNTRKRLLCSRQPHLTQDQKLLAKLAPRLWQLFRTDMELCRRVLKYYINNAWQTRNELVFHDPRDPESARDYLAFLNRLGVEKQQVRFVTYHQNERSQALAEWKKALGLTWRDQIDRLVPPNKSSPATAQWLGIKPLFGHASGAAEAGSYGFRYLLTMATIYVSGS